MACNAHNATIGCHSHSAAAGCHSNTTSGFCDSHIGTVGCPNHDGSAVTDPGIPPCPTNINSFTDELVPGETKVQKWHINELRAAIDAERVRRSMSQVWSGAKVESGDVVDDRDILSLREALDAARVGLSWTHLTPGMEDTGQKVTAIRINEVRSNLEISSTECSCQCNYACTCQCNYSCTCNCNYSCTCNCNYSCTCNCNYSCTCNCYYSDEDLKKNIRFI